MEVRSYWVVYCATRAETIDKVPGFGDIPIIGGLFKNEQTAHERDEIVFLITQHVIYPGSQPLD